ncbi:hypothetical protein [uncultured Maricaulis sp.]|uniref:hypothetical protein n=1 Tax=uncultured Maricaulis sp. TaxID=174710 RepID=UPI0030D7244A|tara:strand:- start:66708 stop:66923 length:216 start_codon:yes stop_codon:yes gene_type:complete
MKNALLVFAVLASAGVVAAVCPASLREELAQKTQIPESVHLEAGRQVELFVSWVRDDAGRPGADFTERNLD